MIYMALPTPRDAYRELIDSGVDSAAKGAYSGAMGLPLNYAQTYKQVYTVLFGSFPSEKESMMQEYNEKAQRLSNTEGIGIRKDANQSGDVAFATSNISTCPIPGLAFTSKKKGCSVSSSSIEASSDYIAIQFAPMVACNDYAGVELGYEKMKSTMQKLMALLRVG